MTNKELVSYFNLKENIDWVDLNSRVKAFLKSDASELEIVNTMYDLLEIVVELDFILFQYQASSNNKSYLDIFKSITSGYYLNPGLGRVPKDLLTLDIKLRNLSDTSKVNELVDNVIDSIMITLVYNFKYDFDLVKLLINLDICKKLCKKYHRKVKLTIDNNKFQDISRKYSKEITYFGFNALFEEDELKSRYRSKALQLHPDKGGNHEKFIECVTNYKTLIKLFENEIQ